MYALHLQVYVTTNDGRKKQLSVSDPCSPTCLTWQVGDRQPPTYYVRWVSDPYSPACLTRQVGDSTLVGEFMDDVRSKMDLTARPEGLVFTGKLLKWADSDRLLMQV